MGDVHGRARGTGEGVERGKGEEKKGDGGGVSLRLLYRFWCGKLSPILNSDLNKGT